MRLGAARLALEGKSGEVARVISNAQFRALREIVSRDVGLTTLTDEIRAEVLDMAVSCAWVGDDETNVDLFRRVRDALRQQAVDVAGDVADARKGMVLLPALRFVPAVDGTHVCSCFVLWSMLCQIRSCRLGTFRAT